MGVIEHRKRGGADIVINKAKVKTWVEKNRVDLEAPVNLEGFVDLNASESEAMEE